MHSEIADRRVRIRRVQQGQFTEGDHRSSGVDQNCHSERLLNHSSRFAGRCFRRLNGDVHVGIVEFEQIRRIRTDLG